MPRRSIFVALLLCAGAFALPHLSAAQAPSAELAAAIAAPTRTPANVARDKYRHPAGTLAFFGVTGRQTVLEYEPEGGWYAEILAPLATKAGGQYIAGQSGDRFQTLLRNKFAADPAYGKAKVVPWPTGDAVKPGSVDTILTFRNVHNMLMGETAPPAEEFREFFRLLKPGGVLGIVDHRLPESADSARERKSGYIKVSTVKRLAEAAGFRFEAASEVNANPKDTADWPDGVWTLPPTLQKGAVDREKYLAIGESDRMTLKFRKPKG